ncbi:juxtaposed with another zinc finger protein 1 [Platysternon megacephalum]|uniref:Juxtaposed with another zinc finger protein 1 n=1 Tax=Platysternon megacephalum TaxID=55544 RepID=A0A4D9EJK3_9SAUR|nr:juxtaposed with another zinc finger protein 1 [Platysternon megacephalum]
MVLGGKRAQKSFHNLKEPYFADHTDRISLTVNHLFKFYFQVYVPHPFLFLPYVPLCAAPNAAVIKMSDISKGNKTHPSSPHLAFPTEVQQEALMGDSERDMEDKRTLYSNEAGKFLLLTLSDSLTPQYNLELYVNINSSHTDVFID